MLLQLKLFRMFKRPNRVNTHHKLMYAKLSMIVLYITICLSVCLPVCLSGFCLSIDLSVRVSVYLSVSISDVFAHKFVF